jgi:hypothetical protein
MTDLQLEANFGGNCVPNMELAVTEPWRISPRKVVIERMSSFTRSAIGVFQPWSWSMQLQLTCS